MTRQGWERSVSRSTDLLFSGYDDPLVKLFQSSSPPLFRAERSERESDKPNRPISSNPL